MKRKYVICMLLSAVMLVGCSKEQLADQETQAKMVEERAQVYYELNEYRTVLDTDLLNCGSEFGFDSEFLDYPSSFFFDQVQYTADDFKTESLTYQTLAKINETCPLVGTYNSLKEQYMNNADYFKEESSMSSEGGCTFSFGLYDNGDVIDADGKGLLCITVQENNVSFYFRGDGTESLSRPIMVYDDRELNVIKTSDVGPWTLETEAFEEEPEVDESIKESVNDDVEIVESDYETPIGEDTEFLDDFIQNEAEVIDSDTLGNMTILMAADQYVNSEDLTSMSSTIQAALRMGQHLRANWLYEDELLTITDKTTEEEISDVIEKAGYIELQYFEWGGGNCRFSWYISPERSKITAYPTGAETVPRMRAYYGDDTDSPWVPHKYRHVMDVTF